jgi:hypothetical protein
MVDLVYSCQEGVQFQFLLVDSDLTFWKELARSKECCGIEVNPT